MPGIVLISVWMVAVEGWGSSLSWFLDQCEPSASLSTSLPMRRDDAEDVPAFRQRGGFGSSPVDGPRRAAGAPKLHLKDEGPASTGFD